MSGSEQEMTTINKLCDEIGPERAFRVLEFALPRIIEFDNDLKGFMLAGEQKAAAECAHRAVSSVRAYGTGQLETLLREISDGGNDFDRLQPALSGEFAVVIDRVETWLQQHK